MTFISYAQNYEDVMLWRAFRTIENGFWIDVGAADPTEFSVTKAFYDRGWRGINVEPEPVYAAALLRDRPRDLNLQLALGARPGRATLQRIAGTGLSTFDASLAAHHAAAGYPGSEPLDVEVTTLAALCAAHAPPDIHFLKIDVEGAEREVLLGADFAKYRPWIIVVEATVPGSTMATVVDFADLLTAADYRQCWFDGLNAFFLAAEQDARLAEHFKAPPNIFDGFLRADHLNEIADLKEALREETERSQRESQAQAARAAEQAARIAELERSWERLRQEISDLEESAQRLRQEIACALEDNASLRSRQLDLERELELTQAALQAVKESSSWRITAPLRAIKSGFRRN